MPERLFRPKPSAIEYHIIFDISLRISKYYYKVSLRKMLMSSDENQKNTLKNIFEPLALSKVCMQSDN